MYGEHHLCSGLRAYKVGLTGWLLQEGEQRLKARFWGRKGKPVLGREESKITSKWKCISAIIAPLICRDLSALCFKEQAQTRRQHTVTTMQILRYVVSTIRPAKEKEGIGHDGLLPRPIDFSVFGRILRLKRLRDALHLGQAGAAPAKPYSGAQSGVAAVDSLPRHEERQPPPYPRSSAAAPAVGAGGIGNQ